MRQTLELGKQRVRAAMAVQIGLIYIWLTDLSGLAGTDTHYSVYLLCGIAGLICLLDNRKGPAPEENRPVMAFFSGLFALAVVFGNYALYQPFYALQNKLNVVLDLLGGYCVGFQVLRCMMRRLPLKSTSDERKHPMAVFLAVFGATAVIDLAYLFFARYPGILTTDSYSTVAQILNGSYNNTMPFWHTILVQLFVKVGLTLFGNMNGAVALFHCFQILLLAAAFGYALMTMYQIGVPRFWLAAVFGVYVLLPYNIVYSITLWKDIPFGASALLLATAFYRLLKDVGNSRKGNMVALVLGALGVSLLRTNGWVAMLVATLLLALFLRRNHRKVLIALLIILVVTWVMLNPLLAALNVSETNMVEVFAVPMQQIARVVANDRPLTQEQTQLLAQIFDLEKMAQLYDPLTVDPVKFETFRYDQVDYIRQHAGEYLKLYFTLGGKYPMDYLKAWIDETKGYWNGGYFFWIYTVQMGQKPVMGILHTGGDNLIARLYAAWFRFAEKPTVLQPLYSIGLRVWILVACCVVNVLKKRREWLITVPCLVLLAWLWLATPADSELRYAYPMILTTPLVLMTTLYSPKQT